MTDATDGARNAAMTDYWNNLMGQVWTRFQAQLDRQLEPLGERAMQALAPQPGERILDVGCGCGDTSLALAERVAPSGVVTGVDISAPMLEVARHRPRAAADLALEFRLADAQTEDLGAGAFDALFSRFGVMFFDDPQAAFANLRRALKPGGRLAFVCWRPLPENPWMGAPMAAARDLLPPTPPADPLAPGPFAFADPERVRGILTEAGFTDISIDPFDTAVGGGDAAATLELNLNIGPLSFALREAPQLREAVAARVSEMLNAYVLPDGQVKMPAAVWIVRAANP